MTQRIKGQEVEIILLVNNEPRENLTTCKSLEWTFKTELLQEGYLGETTDRYDTVYKGVSGNMEFHFNSIEPFNIARSVISKARRRTPGDKINVKFTCNFPSGKRARIVIPDLEFGPMPFGFSERSGYGSFKIDFAASDANVLPA
jgi:hypothetical protein